MRGEICERRWGNEEKELTQRAQRTQRTQRRKKSKMATFRPGCGRHRPQRRKRQHFEAQGKQGCRSPKRRLEAGATKMRKMAT